MTATRLGAMVLLVVLASDIVWAGLLSSWDTPSIVGVLGIVMAVAFLFWLSFRKKRS